MTKLVKAIEQSSVLNTLKRWLHSSLQRKAEWQLSPLFWEVSHRWQGLDFRISKLAFSLRNRKQNTGESVGNLRAILSSIFWPTVTAIAIIIGLEFIEYQFITHSESIYRLLHIPNWLSAFVTTLRTVLSKTRDAYLEFMSAISQIAGAFLGLYFATVGVVISTGYARVTRNVRQLLVGDKLSNHYIRSVALLSASALLLMGSMAAGRQPGILNLFYIALLGVYTIFSAVVLGLRILDFFDPTRLAFKLGADLIGWIDEATPKKGQWSNLHFQAHFQRQAESLLETYRDIVILANREEHLQSSALSELTQNAFTLLRIYVSQKHSIPSNSRWFRQTYKHSGWLTSGDSQASMALGTGTMLQPETIPDLMWFESEIEEVVSISLNGLVARQDLSRAYSFSNLASQALGATAYSYALDEALHLYQTLSPSLRKLSRSIDDQPKRTDEITTRLKIALGLTDIYGFGLISILLRFSDRLRELNAESLGTIVENIKWDQPKSIYLTPLPRQVIQQLEFLRQRLLFEQEVEGKIISPLWYQQQLVALSFLRFIESATARLITELEEVFTKEIEALVQESRYLFAAQLITRGLEACNKFQYHFSEAKNCVDRLAQLRRVEDIPWPLIPWDEYDKKIEEVRERQVVAFGQIAKHLAAIPRTDQMPDYFGHAYSVLTEECYQSLVAGNEKLFEELFPPFFSVNLTTHDQLLTAKISNDPLVQYGFTIQPLLDLFDVSGYAIIYSELYGKNFRQSVTKVWDAYFSAMADAKAQAAMICQKFKLHESRSSWVIYPRDLRRTNWQQIFEQVLRNEGIKEIDFDFRWSEQEGKHPSKVIRILSQGIFPFYQGRDVFLALYFVERFGRDSILLPRDAEGFLRDLNFDNNRQKESLEE